MNLITISGGQSNNALPLGVELCRRVNKYGPLFHTFASGQALTHWVAGASPSYTRGTGYTNMTAKALPSITGIEPTRVVLFFMQGESDADSGSNALGDLWTGKLDAMIAFLKTDFSVTDVKTCVGIPHHRSDASGAVQGYYANLRTKILEWVASDTNNRVACETSDLERPAGDVHMTAWQNIASGQIGSTNFGIYNLAQRMAVASAPFYRP